MVWSQIDHRQLCKQGPAMVYHLHTREDGWWSYSCLYIPPTVDERLGASIGYRLGNISGPAPPDSNLGSFTHLHNSGLCRRCLGLTGRAAHLRYDGLCYLYYPCGYRSAQSGVLSEVYNVGSFVSCKVLSWGLWVANGHTVIEMGLR